MEPYDNVRLHRSCLEACSRQRMRLILSAIRHVYRFPLPPEFS